MTDVLGADAAITPSDLCNQQFRRSVFGGYHPDEVDVFLERVANVFEFLLTQMKGLKEKNEEQKELLEEYRQMEEALRNAIVSSQKFGQDILENAKREAHALVQEGHLKKAQTELEAAKIPVKLSQDIRLLQEHRARLRRDMQAVLETHARLLDSLVPEEDAVEAAQAAMHEEEPPPEVPAVPEGFADEMAAVEPAVEPAEEPVDQQVEEPTVASAAGAAEEPELAPEGAEEEADSEAVLLELADDGDGEEEEEEEEKEEERQEDVSLEGLDGGDAAMEGDDVSDSKEEPPYAGV